MKGRHVVIRPGATHDLRELAAHIELDSEGAAKRFEEAAAVVFAELLEMPELGASREWLSHRLPGLRMWPIPRFPNHLVFYRPTAAGIEIVRVLHAARDIDVLFTSEE